MDELEKYIRNNKEKLNTDPPSENLFNKINQKLKAEDDLEIFIKKNKEALDTHIPSEKNWDKIKNKINLKKTEQPPQKAKVVSLNFVWKMAASFLIILCASVYLVWNLASSYNEKTESTRLTLEEISPELAQAEMYYSQVIKEHITLLNAYTTVDSQIKEEFKKDIAELDKAYTLLGNDLMENADNEIIVSEMIQNLQIRVELLSQQIMILENIKQQKNENANAHNL